MEPGLVLDDFYGSFPPKPFYDVSMMFLELTLKVNN